MPVCFIFMQSQVMLLDLQVHSAPKYALSIVRSRGKGGYKQSIHKLVKKTNFALPTAPEHF